LKPSAFSRFFPQQVSGSPQRKDEECDEYGSQRSSSIPVFVNDAEAANGICFSKEEERERTFWWIFLGFMAGFVAFYFLVKAILKWCR
jgi:hypothetical protein